MKKYRAAIVGCGVIADQYIANAQRVYSDYFEITALTDLDVHKAEAYGEKYGIALCGLPELAYESREIDLIINLTVPNAHEEVTVRALESGKHVYTEKPLATSREGMQHILETAKRTGLRVGCAPDSFLSARRRRRKKRWKRIGLVRRSVPMPSAPCAAMNTGGRTPISSTTKVQAR